MGNFYILRKLKNPTWINPLTDESIPGGNPKNPLGHYWIEFWTDGRDSIGMHGTPNPETVGKTISHGCIRMYNKDVEDLFQKVSVGTPVIVVR
ncbi:MAG: L,D-transpeptidase [Aetokthonos hydrillicola CCALA 1050]|nr:L,D-transpeptidase [Aetokthonos hydrillicola]MBO3462659.1 L,D-transpeptidase [Aetokthonos hydrillicola CCALA 1050]MBW4589887.1 L,D-transpeptidase [Aetokthonos hydrillicola CCALA 1050]